MRRWALVVVLAVAPGARAAELSLPQAAAVDAAVAGQIEKQKLVGVAVGVIRDGEIAYLKGYGHANREKNVALTTRTVMNWASNSKPLAAVMAMQLVQQGKLDLDANVCTLVPEFPDKGKCITVRQLLCHQSGLPHYVNGKVIGVTRTYATSRPFMDPVCALDRFSGSPLLFDPGAKTSYTTYGYILLCAAIQKAGGKAFAEQLQERIVKPVGLKSFQYDVPYTGQPDWAVGYGKKGNEVVPIKDEAHYWKHGGGGFKSNIEDFAKWAAVLTHRTLLDEATEKAMWTNQTTADGKRTAYGLGFQVSNAGGMLVVSHGGAQDETKTRLTVRPTVRSGVVVMSNCGFADVNAVAKSVEDALAGIPK